MEKSRAIELLEHLAWDRDIERNPYGDALNMAIKALKAQHSNEGTTSDLISRQEAIDEINHICPVDTEYDCTLLDRVDVRCVLSDLPTIQSEPHEGEWEQVSAQRYFMSASYFYRCSACGVNNVRNTNYCPNCGAKMTISTK